MIKRKKISHKPVKKTSKGVLNSVLKTHRQAKKRIKLAKTSLFSLREQVFILLRDRQFVKRSFAVIFTVTFCETVFYLAILKDLPNPATLTTSPSPATTIIRDRNGVILYKVYKDANRIKLDWDQIPRNVKEATLAIEDADFYHHRGASLKSIIRAFLHNFGQKNANLYQGGSTITQQLMKNRIVGGDKTYIRKIKEIFLALWAETQFSKNDILRMYLNEVGYGGPAYGIQTAAQMYFGIDAKDLTLAQAAFLVGLPAAPTTFSPFGSNPTLAYIRQKEVLGRMLKLKMISQKDYNAALSENLVFVAQKIDIQAPHFVMFVKDQLVQKLGEARVTQGGLDVTTTLDLNIQNMAQEAVKKQVEEIKDIYNIHNSGVLITHPKTGEILAMVGSADYFDIANKGYVNVTLAKRQPGSSIKPVNYAYALDHGYTPNTPLDDSPVTYVAPGMTETYTPVNYDGKFHGTVTVRAALANSYNVPAVKVLNSYGVDKMVDEGRAMGIKSWYERPQAGLSLTLGGAEVTMADMSRAYGTIANLGVRKELKFITSIKDEFDNDITGSFYDKTRDLSLVGNALADENQQVVSPLAAYWLTDILSDDAARLPAFGPFAKLTVPGYKIAVKTGTSNNFRDNWTIGFTPSYLTAVWVGNNDGSFMNKNLTSGITGAAPIWNEIMTNLLKNTVAEAFEVPLGLIPIRICATNGLLTCPYCPSEKTEYFTADKIPTRKCFFRSPQECTDAQKQTEGKSDDEKKQIMAGCPVVITPAPN